MKQTNNTVKQAHLESPAAVSGTPVHGQDKRARCALYEPATGEQLTKLSDLMQTEMPEHVNLLSDRQVANRLSITRKQLVALHDDDPRRSFPTPVELIPGLVRWAEHEINDYLKCQILHRNVMFAMSILAPRRTVAQ